MRRVFGVKTEIDNVLGAVAPIGLAAAAETAALVVDLDPFGPAFPGERSLADIVAEGPRRQELTPAGGALALLRNGGVDWEAAAETIERLAAAWPALVLRVPIDAQPLPWPVIPVVPLLPGFLSLRRPRAAVWQLTERGQKPPGPGPALPPLSRVALTSLLELRPPPARRWVRSWRAVWALPWP
jgi:hypothetical protein